MQGLINESPNPTVGAAITRLKFLVTAKIQRRDVGQWPKRKKIRWRVGPHVFKIRPAGRVTQGTPSDFFGLFPMLAGHSRVPSSATVVFDWFPATLRVPHEAKIWPIAAGNGCSILHTRYVVASDCQFQGHSLFYLSSHGAKASSIHLAFCFVNKGIWLNYHYLLWLG